MTPSVMSSVPNASVSDMSDAGQPRRGHEHRGRRDDRGRAEQRDARGARRRARAAARATRARAGRRRRTAAPSTATAPWRRSSGRACRRRRASGPGRRRSRSCGASSSGRASFSSCVSTVMCGASRGFTCGDRLSCRRLNFCPARPKHPARARDGQRPGPPLSFDAPPVDVPEPSADVAQLVEHFTRNEGVAGSSPAVGSSESPAPAGFRR